MKQLILRLIPGATGVLDAVFGEIKDGQFSPLSPDDFPVAAFSHIVVDDLLGTQAYLQTCHLTSVVSEAISLGCHMALYPNFIVLTFPDNEPKEEKNS